MKRDYLYLSLGATILVLASHALAVYGSGQDGRAPKVDLKKMKATVEGLESPVTLELVDTPLKDVLMYVERSSQLKFGWEFEILPGEKAVTLSAKAEPLGESIQKALNAIGWTYAIRPDGEVLLRPVPQPPRKGALP
jgi:hypothetical protein